MAALRRVVFFVQLRRFNQTQFSGHCKIGHRAVYNQLVEPVLEEVLLNWYRTVEIGDAHLGEMHDSSDIELVDPVATFADP